MTFKYFIFTWMITLAFACKCNSQCLSVNLIENPSLEEYTCCPTNIAMIACANNWTQPLPLAGCSSEYYNTCGIDSVDDQLLLSMFQHAYFGNGYAGIRTYVYDNPWDVREYIQGTLSGPLIADQCYHCEFWVKLSNLKNTTPFVAIDALSIFFSDTLPKTTSNINEVAMYFPSQINNQIGRIITDTTDWTLISGNFVATGGEQYFTVGTFSQDSDISKIYFGTPHTDFAYYFFDNFSLCPCDDTIPPVQPANAIFIPNIFSPNSDGSNDKFCIKGENISQINIKIFSRWGNLVFESNDPALGWDGRFKGKDCPDGVYFYSASVIFTDGTTETKKGSVTIIR